MRFRQRSVLSKEEGHRLLINSATTAVRPRLSRVKRHASRGISPEVYAVDDLRLACANLAGNVFDVNP